MTAAVELFYGIPALAANGLVLLALVALLTRRFDDLADAIGDRALPLAAIVAVAATAGSLYFSEVVGFVPCRLCWFQRIFMYPLALIVPLAAFVRDARVRLYAVPLALFGGAISAYHYLIEWVPSLEGEACSSTISCTAVWFRTFGFMSLSYLALSAFAAIVVLLALQARRLALRELDAEIDAHAATTGDLS